MSILSKLKRLVIRKNAVHETTYSAHGCSVVLETTRDIRKLIRDEDVESMSKLALDEYVSDFELDKIASHIEEHYNLSKFGVAILLNGPKEIIIYVQ